MEIVILILLMSLPARLLADGAGPSACDLARCPDPGAKCVPGGSTAGGIDCTSCRPGYTSTIFESNGNRYGATVCVRDSQLCADLYPNTYSIGSISRSCNDANGCRVGYELVGAQCQDINECRRDGHGCAAPSECLNLPGSYVCACPNPTLNTYDRAAGRCVPTPEAIHDKVPTAYEYAVLLNESTTVTWTETLDTRIGVPDPMASGTNYLYWRFSGGSTGGRLSVALSGVCESESTFEAPNTDLVVLVFHVSSLDRTVAGTDYWIGGPSGRGQCGGLPDLPLQPDTLYDIGVSPGYPGMTLIPSPLTATFVFTPNPVWGDIPLM